MTFELALTNLRQRQNQKRAGWVSWLHWPPGSDSIYRTWPSGCVTVYEPTAEDLTADDWVGGP